MGSNPSGGTIPFQFPNTFYRLTTVVNIELDKRPHVETLMNVVNSTTTKIMGALTGAFVVGVIALGAVLIYNGTVTTDVASADGHDCTETYTKMKAQYPDFPIGCPDVERWLSETGKFVDDAYPIEGEVVEQPVEPVVVKQPEVVVDEPVVPVQSVDVRHVPTQSAAISHTEVTDAVCLTVTADTSAAVEAAASAWMESPLTQSVQVVDSATHSDAIQATICAEMVINLDAEVNVSAEVSN